MGKTGNTEQLYMNFLEIFPESETRLRRNEPMSLHSTFKAGGNADLFLQASSEDEIIKAVELSAREDIQVTVLGNGSNILVSDKGIRGLVICLGKSMSEVSVAGNLVTAQAGTLLSKVSAIAAHEGLEGMEFASGIPGTVGGAVYMNAGAYDGSIATVLEKSRGLDASALKFIELRGADEHLFGYRQSYYSVNNAIVLSASFRLIPGDKEEILEKMKDFSVRRASSQPLDIPSAGSTFKRPEGHFAGKLIEDSGLKGFRMGRACVSEKHAGFVLNDQNASAREIYTLIKYVQNKVFEDSNVMLEPEVRILGEW